MSSTASYQQLVGCCGVSAAAAAAAADHLDDDDVDDQWLGAARCGACHPAPFLDHSSAANTNCRRTCVIDAKRYLLPPSCGSYIQNNYINFFGALCRNSLVFNLS